ncbi:MAG TPA: hypothetical protein DCR93_26140 [Cytophagales bacterium]|nr:hypothetical protein [Cytophagales bacterium]
MSPQPPRLIIALLDRILLPEIHEDIMGDLTEEFHRQLGQRSVARSRWWYAAQAIRLCRPRLVRKPAMFHRNNNLMFTAHLHTAWRQIQHHRQSAFVNLLGYTLALVAVALLWLYVAHEKSYDQHHPHAEETYRISSQQFNPDGELTRHFEASAPRLGPTLAEDFSEVADMVRIFPWNYPSIMVGEKVLHGQQTAAVDPSFFNFFETKFIQGQPDKALQNPHSLVVTATKAEALFGPDWREESLVGKLIDFTTQDTTLSFTITAVIEDMPRQQHLQFNYLCPLAYLEGLQPARFQQRVMGDYNFFTYLHLPNGYDNIEAGMAEFIDRHQGPGEDAAASELYKLYFQKLTDIHLDAGHNGVLGVAGDLQQVQIFIAIGLLIGIVACVNYINLATARFRRRWREMAVRKVNGAHRRQLLGQFMVETWLMLTSATLLAAGIVALTVDMWEAFVDRDLTTGIGQMSTLWVGFAILLGSMWVLSGVYPALYLSQVQIGSLLHSKSEAPGGKYDYRSVLVGFQYVVAIGLLISLGVINRQFNYIDTFETGFRRDRIVHFRMPGALRPRAETFRAEVTKHPDIESITYNSRVPAGNLGDALDGSLPDVEGMTTIPFRLPFITIDEYFSDTYQVQPVAGSMLTIPAEGDTLMEFMVNETAARLMGFPNPADIVGQRFEYGWGKGFIVGVLEDFHFESLRETIRPMTYMPAQWFSRASVAYSSQADLADVYHHIQGVWDEMGSPMSFRPEMLEERYQAQYEAEARTQKMIRWFSTLALLVVALGILGLVQFAVESRTKEIGIRKVLGARMGQLIWVIGRPFLIIIGVGAVLATGITYFLAQEWLTQFVFRPPLSLDLFIWPLVIALGLTALVAGWHTLKAAFANPTEALRSE